MTFQIREDFAGSTDGQAAAGGDLRQIELGLFRCEAVEDGEGSVDHARFAYAGALFRLLRRMH